MVNRLIVPFLYASGSDYPEFWSHHASPKYKLAYFVVEACRVVDTIRSRDDDLSEYIPCPTIIFERYFKLRVTL